MIDLSLLLSVGRRIETHRPWPGIEADPVAWAGAIDGLAAGDLTLLSVWGEPGRIHMALLGPGDPPVAVLSLACDDGRYPAVSRLHPPAIRLERTVRDLYGLEPGHFRFTCDGETVVRLEERLGYVHKGIDALLTGADLGKAARIAARTSGDSTVAYSLGFARAVEAALGVAVPPRAVWLRAVMAELERIANHFGDFGAICNDASFSMMLAHCAVLRERVLRAAAICFGHRLMMDRIVPGGVTADLDRTGDAMLRALVVDLGAKFRPLVKLYDNTASLQDRTVTTGILKPELARRFGAGGYVGRASGRNFDARRMPGYPPYDSLRFEVPVLTEGDVNARAWIRIREIEQSLSLLEQLLRGLPTGPVSVPVPGGSGAGVALVESFRGDVLVWLRIADGVVERCHLRDPSWFTWPLLEAVIEGNIVADFPLCNKSFNCSYSGTDL